ncbi:MAG TPA: site-specific integrase, partial [Paraburkholderia sp.]|nr:site-specific integrase [Paraburkholderia sp.]
MASIIRKGSKWQARVIRKGFPAQSKSFNTKAEAQLWANEIENSMLTGVFEDVKADLAVTLGELIQRYLDTDPKL